MTGCFRKAYKIAKEGRYNSFIVISKNYIMYKLNKSKLRIYLSKNFIIYKLNKSELRIDFLAFRDDQVKF